MRRALISLYRFMVGADLVFVLLPLIMVNLVAGTLAQRDLGLYVSHRLYFSSFYYRVGFLPLPGGYTLLGILTAALALKFLFRTQWRFEKTGINLAHLGALVLLGGGLVSSISAREAYMVLGGASATPYIYDYHQRQLFIFRDDLLAQTVAFENLRGMVEGPSRDFSLSIREACKNCAIVKAGPEMGRKNMAGFMSLAPKPLEKEDEANLSGVTFDLKTGSQSDEGTYIAFENMPKPIVFRARGHAYKIMFGKAQRALPFSLALVNFDKSLYPGTDRAKAYAADVTVKDGGLAWPAHLEMNAPLRYKGYTFYLSSFQESSDGLAVILNVVENKGRLVPYAGTFIIAAGLAFHCFLARRRI